jgi:hypothetical protein
MAKLKIVAAPLLMAGAAAGWLAAAPYAVADAYAAAGTSITQFAPQSPGGDGCTVDGYCYGGDASGGSGTGPNGTWGHGDASGGGGCNTQGVCGHGGPGGGGGCVPWIGCFEWGG